MATATATATAPAKSGEPAPAAILSIGRRLSAGEPQEEVGIPLDRLPYHTCVFASSGSDQTVFLKRAIEEAALLGIPSATAAGKVTARLRHFDHLLRNRVSTIGFGIRLA
jgi:hypothetical protein